MFCGKCGAANADGAKFCGACGAPLGGNARGTAAAAEKKNSTRVIGIVASVILVALIAFVLILVFRACGKDEPDGAAEPTPQAEPAGEAAAEIGGGISALTGTARDAVPAAAPETEWDGIAEKTCGALAGSDLSVLLDMIPGEVLDSALSESGMTRSGMDEYLNTQFGEVLEKLEVQLGGGLSAAYEILGSEDVTDSALENIRRMYAEQFSLEVAAAKTAEVTMTVSAPGGEESRTGEIPMVQVDGTWYLDIYDFDIDDIFPMPDFSARAEATVAEPAVEMPDYEVVADKVCRAIIDYNIAVVFDLMPGEVVDALMSQSGMTQSEFDQTIEARNAEFRGMVEELEAETGGEVSISYVVLSFESVTGDDLENIRRSYEEEALELEITAAKNVHVMMTASAADGNRTRTGIVPLIQIDGLWYLDASGFNPFDIFPMP